MMRGLALLATTLALGGCLSAAAPQIAEMTDGSALAKLGPPQQSDDIMGGGRYKEPWLSAAIKDAAQHPLGSAANPVRADAPGGQRAYLARLRCADGRGRPSSARAIWGSGLSGRSWMRTT